MNKELIEAIRGTLYDGVTIDENQQVRFSDRVRDIEPLTVEENNRLIERAFCAINAILRILERE